MKHSEPPSPQYLTPSELATRWKITTMTLRRWRKDGRIKVAFMGRGIRFSMTEIERFEREAEA
ncbi:MAG: helix-turn-helix domain-containing protein [Verrucomicrobia bacterium]|nr:helix-turn-helix domain-containing protein [Verrucomicrobiota bacterium]